MAELAPQLQRIHSRRDLQREMEIDAKVEQRGNERAQVAARIVGDDIDAVTVQEIDDLAHGRQPDRLVHCGRDEG